MRSWLIYILLISFVGIANATDYRFRHMTTDDGLTHNQVNDIYQDSHGFMWLSTAWGLNFYDGYRLKTFLASEDSTSLKSNFVGWVRDISGDKMLVHTSAGDCIYDRNTDKFSYDVSKYRPEGSYELDLRTYVDRHYNVWVANKDALYVSLGGETDLKMVMPSVPHEGDITGITENNDRVVYAMWNGQIGSIDISMLDSETKTINSEVINGILPRGRNLPYVDEDGDFWFSNRDIHGVWRYFPRSNKWAEYNHTASSEVKVPDVMIRNILQDKQGIIWIATDHGGLVLYDKKTGTTLNIRHNHNDYYSILDDATNCIFGDRDGTMWVGYYQSGLSYYNPSNFKFGLDRLDDMVNEDPAFMSNITCVEHDGEGNIWLGTNGCGLVRIDGKTGEKRRYRHDDKNPNSLPSDVIVTLKAASDGNLWIGTFMGGLSIFDGKNFSNYIHSKRVPASVSCTSIWAFDESDDGVMWIGSLNSGMASYDPKNKIFKEYNRAQDGILSDYVSDLIYSKTNKCLYIASQKGISVMSLVTNEQGVNYTVRELDSESRYPLLHEHIHQLVEDSRGLLWVGTRTGLCVFDPLSNTSKAFKLHVDGTNDYVTAVAEDEKHDIWCATSDGLVNIKVENSIGSQEKYKYTLSKYSKDDGLENGVYNQRAIHTLPDGRVFVGRSFGLSVFDPKVLSLNQEPPQVTFTSLRLYGEEVHPQEVLFGARPLDTQLYLSSEGISVPSKISMITVEFSTLNYILSHKTSYTYRLDGKEGEVKTTTKPEATFTNLLPGTYTLYVSATNADGFSNHYEYPLTITILPPWYASKIAFVVYTLLFVFAVWCLVQLLMYYIQLRHRGGIEMTPEMQRKILAEHKEQFFNNVARELSAPIGALLPPLEKLKGDPQITGDSLTQLTLVDKNVKMLQKTLTSIVGLHELGVDNIRLVAVRADLVSHLRKIYKAFEGENTKDLEYTFQSSQPNIMMDFDADKITTAVSNLLSNASKFTPDYGQIALSIDAYPDYVKINVTDTGVGISDKHKALIFNKYYQVDTGSTTGYGLGLHVTREIVQMHNGTIEVKDNPAGSGTQFIITLPYVQNNAKGVQSVSGSSEAEKEEQVSVQSTVADGELLESVKAYVLKHILSEITVDDLARHLRSSKVQLYKKIMQATNMSPVEYIRHIRLAEAAKMLMDGKYTVDEVAVATGFSVVDYFEQYFIEEYGISPLEYQQRYNKGAK